MNTGNASIYIKSLHFSKHYTLPGVGETFTDDGTVDVGVGTAVPSADTSEDVRDVEDAMTAEDSALVITDEAVDVTPPTDVATVDDSTATELEDTPSWTAEDTADGVGAATETGETDDVSTWTVDGAADSIGEGTVGNIMVAEAEDVLLWIVDFTAVGVDTGDSMVTESSDALT